MRLSEGGGEGAYSASTALPLAEGGRGDLKAQAPIGSSMHPLAPGNGGPAVLLWPRQIDRETVVLLCLLLVNGVCQGPSPVSGGPSVSCPQSMSPGQ